MRYQPGEVGAQWYLHVWDSGAVENQVLGKVLVEQVLEQIPDPLSRFIFKLTVEEWTPKEIADHVGISAKDVQRRLNRANRGLRTTASTWRHAL
jgi:DNA-directed RNA polymerase specialized sigma24 family protein